MQTGIFRIFSFRPKISIIFLTKKCSVSSSLQVFNSVKKCLYRVFQKNCAVGVLVTEETIFVQLLRSRCNSKALYFSYFMMRPRSKTSFMGRDRELK